MNDFPKTLSLSFSISLSLSRSISYRINVRSWGLWHLEEIDTPCNIIREERSTRRHGCDAVGVDESGVLLYLLTNCYFFVG